MDALVQRAAEVGLTLDPVRAERLWVYFELLAKWNARINLTGLRVAPDNGEAIDRLLIEPMLASTHAALARAMVDVGSGGGSPAIPFAIAAASGPALTMVESRERKSSFLREALRETGLTGEVLTARFEDFAESHAAAETFDLLTIRAVRMDPHVFGHAAAVLTTRGRLFWFHERNQVRSQHPAGFRWQEAEPLLLSLKSVLSIARKEGPDRFT